APPRRARKRGRAQPAGGLLRALLRPQRLVLRVGGGRPSRARRPRTVRDKAEHQGESGALGIGARRCRDAEGVSDEVDRTGGSAGFGGAEPWTLGVEEELFFVDVETLDARPGFTLVVGEPDERVKPEVFESLVELTTPVL